VNVGRWEAGLGAHATWGLSLQLLGDLLPEAQR
jgi:hypothetical protein